MVMCSTWSFEPAMEHTLIGLSVCASRVKNDRFYASMYFYYLVEAFLRTNSICNGASYSHILTPLVRSSGNASALYLVNRRKVLMTENSCVVVE